MLSALDSGSIDAAQFNPPLLYYAKKKGFRDLLDIGAHVKMPLGGLTTLVTTIQNRPAEMRRLIRAMQLAKRNLLQSKEKSVELMTRVLKLNRETAEDTFVDYQKTVSGNGVPSRDGIEQIVKSLQLLGQFVGRKVGFEEVADARIAQEKSRRNRVTRLSSLDCGGRRRCRAVQLCSSQFECQCYRGMKGGERDATQVLNGIVFRGSILLGVECQRRSIGSRQGSYRLHRLVVRAVCRSLPHGTSGYLPKTAFRRNS